MSSLPTPKEEESLLMKDEDTPSLPPHPATSKRKYKPTPPSSPPMEEIKSISRTQDDILLPPSPKKQQLQKVELPLLVLTERFPADVILDHEWFYRSVTQFLGGESIYRWMRVCKHLYARFLTSSYPWDMSVLHIWIPNITVLESSFSNMELESFFAALVMSKKEAHDQPRSKGYHDTSPDWIQRVSTSYTRQIRSLQMSAHFTGAHVFHKFCSYFSNLTHLRFAASHCAHFRLPLDVHLRSLTLESCKEMPTVEFMDKLGWTPYSLSHLDTLTLIRDDRNDSGMNNLLNYLLLWNDPSLKTRLRLEGVWKLPHLAAEEGQPDFYTLDPQKLDYIQLSYMHHPRVEDPPSMIPWITKCMTQMSKLNHSSFIVHFHVHSKGLSWVGDVLRPWVSAGRHIQGDLYDPNKYNEMNIQLSSLSMGPRSPTPPLITIHGLYTLQQILGDTYEGWRHVFRTHSCNYLDTIDHVDLPVRKTLLEKVGCPTLYIKAPYLKTTTFFPHPIPSSTRSMKLTFWHAYIPIPPWIYPCPQVIELWINVDEVMTPSHHLSILSWVADALVHFPNLRNLILKNTKDSAKSNRTHPPFELKQKLWSRLPTTLEKLDVDASLCTYGTEEESQRLNLMISSLGNILSERRPRFCMSALWQRHLNNDSLLHKQWKSVQVPCICSSSSEVKTWETEWFGQILERCPHLLDIYGPRQYIAWSLNDSIRWKKLQCQRIRAYLEIPRETP